MSGTPVSDRGAEPLQVAIAKCPRCRVGLEVVTREGISWAGCPKCGGVWLSAADLVKALRLYAADQGVALETVALLEGPAQASAIPCPECSSGTLLLITLRGVEVEKCVSCRGVFLDRGEGEKIAERAVLASATWEPAHQELLQLVRERLSFEMTLRAALRSDFQE